MKGGDGVSLAGYICLRGSGGGQMRGREGEKGLGEWDDGG